MRRTNDPIRPRPRPAAEPRRRFEAGDQRQFLGEIVQERLGKRRFYALAAAIREHEAEARLDPTGIEPHDAELYRRLRLICGEL